MKNLLLSVLSIFICFNLFSQEEFISRKTAAGKENIQSLYLMWNKSTNSYDSSSRSINNYSITAPETVSVYQSYTNGVWVNSSKRLTFEGDSVLIYLWDQTNSMWNLASRSYYSYNSFNLQDEVLQYKKGNGGQFYLYSTTKSYYNNDSNRISYVNKYYTPTNSIFMGDSSYNAFDTLTRIQEFQWYDYDNLQQMWVPERKRLSYYNNDNLVDSMIYLTYINGNFNNSDKYIYTRINTPPTTITLNQEWNSTNNSWEMLQRSTTSYNHFGMTDTVLKEDFINNTWSLSSRNLILYDNDEDITDIFINLYKNNTWENFTWSQHYYATGTGINEPTQNNLIIFPNPTAGKITLKTSKIEVGATIKIFNVSGLMIISEKTRDQFHTVDLTDYPSGIYLIEVKTQQGKYLQKTIKR